MTEAEQTVASGSLAVGTRLGEEGRYQLTQLTGTGGMASVWTAHDARLDRTVAVKVIADTLALDPLFVERFAREARLAGGLSHPHVVQVFDYGTHGTRPYLVMEHVTGGTLGDRLKQGGGGWDPVVLARELLGALGYIHDRGILHRDLKPANVLIGADGRARLTDFGIAQLADATRLTTTGVMGTARYTAPEVMRGRPPSRSSDLFSCGVLLAECAANAPALRTLVDALRQADPQCRPANAERALELLAQAKPADPSAELAPTVAVAAPTRVLHSPPSVAPPSVAPSRRLPRVRTRAVLATAALAGFLVVGLALAGGDGASAPLQLPPGGETLVGQLDQLDAAVDRARR